eukprot:Nk52_evm4s392 gene=Nk52_evmTU4s392
MGGPARLRRKKVHKGIRDLKRKYKVKRRTKDLDQIHEDLTPEKRAQLENQEVDLDLPGMGQFYCVECSRYFTTEVHLREHVKSKIHRRRLKELKCPPYTQAEAEAAAGMTR